MLSDTSRKILRILWNLNRSEATILDPTKLAKLSQRELGPIRDALQQLKDEQYIEWDPPSGIVRVIESKERKTNNLNWWK